MTSDLHHFAAAYALDAVTADERRQFEEHFPLCEVCSGDVKDYRATSAALAEGAVVTPPADLKAKVMAEIAVTRQLPPILSDNVIDLAERQRRRAPRPVLLAAAAAALVLVVALALSTLSNNGSDDYGDLLAAPDATLPRLDGDSAMVSVLWSSEMGQAAVLATGLPDPGEGKAYALWILQADGPQPAGVFGLEGGAVRQTFDLDLDSVSGWGITIEDEAGSPVPTSDVIYVNSF